MSVIFCSQKTLGDSTCRTRDRIPKTYCRRRLRGKMTKKQLALVLLVAGPVNGHVGASWDVAFSQDASAQTVDIEFDDTGEEPDFMRDRELAFTCTTTGNTCRPRCSDDGCYTVRERPPEGAALKIMFFHGVGAPPWAGEEGAPSKLFPPCSGPTRDPVQQR